MSKISIVLILSLCVMSMSLMAQNKSFVINGTITGRSNGIIYLAYQKGDRTKRVMDSAVIEKGKFSFKGEVDGVVQAHVLSEKNPRTIDKYLQILLTPGELKLSFSSNNFSEGILSGTVIQDEMNQLNQSKAALMTSLKTLQQNYDEANMRYIVAVKEKNDSVTIKVLKDSATMAKDAMGPVIRQVRQKDLEFMDANPASFVTATLLSGYIAGFGLAESLERFEKLSEEVKISNIGVQVYKEIEKLKTGSPGSIAFVFTSKELRGEQLNLADYKGKYVLIDFWASWCVPCRKGNPHLLNVYAKYKEKGFEIVGVSDDDSNTEAWKKAIDHDKIAVWKHILRGLKKTPDGDYDRSMSINDKYAVVSLPTKILIDPKGKIIGRFVGDDEAMDKQLAEIFGF